MYRKILLMTVVALLLLQVNFAHGYARWRNGWDTDHEDGPHDQDFSNPENWFDRPGLYTGRMVLNRGLDHPSRSTLPPIFSYTPDPCYSPIDLRGPGHDSGTSFQWYITGGSMHVRGPWQMCYNSNTTGYTEMTGGYLRFDDDILCPASIPASATLLLHGGIVWGPGIQFQSGGLIDIAGSGKLILDGNDVVAAQEWVTSGYLTADGGLGDINISYDAGADLTIIIGSSVRAWEPQPEDAQENLCPGVDLTWKPGANAAATQGHDVYFGTDYDDVDNATTSTAGIYIGRQDGNSYTPTLVMNKTYYWRVDEVGSGGAPIWKGNTWEFTTNDGTAFDPNAADKELGFPVDGVLSWSPGCLADTHNVYFGTDFNDVNDATTSTVDIFKGNQPGTSYDPDGELEHLADYYWRIDEVGTGGSPVWKGDTWAFRTESAIFDPNLRLWYTFDGTEEENGDVIHDHSGREFHTSDGTVSGRWEPNDGRFAGSLWCDDDIGCGVSPNMLKFSGGVTFSVWLKDSYRAGDDNTVFGVGDGEYEIRCDVPDSTDQILFRAGNDSNDVIQWRPNEDPTTLEGWHHYGFVKNETTGEISIYFDGRLAISADTAIATLSNFESQPFKLGASGSTGADLVAHIDDFRVYDYPMNFSEVARLFRGEDAELAWLPIPVDNASDVAREVTLEWLPGDFAGEHDVYLGTDFVDVNNADTTSSVYKGRQALEALSYDAGTLSLNTTYFWRIDEVNDTDANSPWKGSVWKFKVANFIIVDDMESYDPFVERIWYHWDNPWGTGSFVELGVAPFAPVHGGSKSMEYLYDNVTKWDFFSYWSEVECAFDSSQDWTESGLQVLTLFFYGDPDNDANDTEQLAVGLEDSATDRTDIDYPDMNDIQKAEWIEWNLVISDFTDVDADAIDKIYIRFGNYTNETVPGGDGIVYFDDIRLYPPKCVPSLGPALDFSGDCVVGFAEIAMMGQDWLLSDVLLSPITPPDPCVLHYRFDESSGSNIADSAGSYNGTFFDDVNQTPADIAGHIDSDSVSGNSFHFTHDSDANLGGIKIPTTVFTDNAISQEISVSAWIKNVYPNENPDGTAFMWEFRQWDGLTTDPGDRVLAVQVGGNGDTYTLMDSSESVEYDQEWDEITEWTHYSFIRDASNLKIYVNGVLEVVDDSNGAPMAEPDLIYLGLSADRVPGNPSGLHDGFTGNMDDFIIFDYALSAAQAGHLGTAGTGYVPMPYSIMDLYQGDPPGSKGVNFRDYAVLMNSWLETQLWPE